MISYFCLNLVLDDNLYGDETSIMRPQTRPAIIDSTLLTEQQNVELSSQIAPKNDAEFKLCYRASEHGFSGSTFHSRCDNLGETIIVARTTSTSQIPGRIFGAYAPNSWQSTSSTYIDSEDAFLYRFTEEDEFQRTGMMSRADRAQYNHVSNCPGFGTSISICFAAFNIS